MESNSGILVNSNALALPLALIFLLLCNPIAAPRVYTSNGDSLQSESKERTRMIVLFDRDRGFMLKSTGEVEEYFFVDFANEHIKKKFEDLFSQENLKNIEGLRIFCECQFEDSLETEHSPRRLVKDATFFYGK